MTESAEGPKMKPLSITVFGTICMESNKDYRGINQKVHFMDTGDAIFCVFNQPRCKGKAERVRSSHSEEHPYGTELVSNKDSAYSFQYFQA